MLRSKLGKFFVSLLVLGLLIYTITPKPKLTQGYSYSTAVYDEKGRLLRLSLSMDDKYRLFVAYKDIPPDLISSLKLYEDNYFDYHLGVNPFSMIRAAFDMIKGSRKQGASTITMQLARIIYNIDSSKISGKIEQILRAIQIEMFYSKQEILEAYFNLAPYGGNIEGVGAASLIYFGERAENLNLPQIVALTVVPQNPNKRNLSSKSGQEEVWKASARLKKIWKQKHATRDNSHLDLPLQTDKHLPFHAPHFVRFITEKNSGEIFSSLDLDMQKMLEDIVNDYVKENNNKGVYNASALIVNYKTMEVKAYVGSNDFFNEKINGQVDGTNALRSPGSALKPFIYAIALDEGLIHPLTMLKDVPKNYGLYTPENFDRSFYGLVSATSALVYSRNIPAVDLLLQTRKDAFYDMLKQAGVKNLRSSDFYGLALALGGFEVSLQDIATMYAMLGNLGEMKELKFIKEYPEKEPLRIMSKEAAFLTLDMLSYNEDIDKRHIPFTVKEKDYPVYWKTGTSFGFKDAVTAGIVGDYVIVVWVGNFDATPNNHFIGRKMAAPLFFKVVRNLAKYYKINTENKSAGLNLARVDICSSTGDLADQNCNKTIKSYFIPGVSSIKLSNVSRRIPVDIKTGLRACRHTPPTTKMEVYEFWPSDILKAYELAGISPKRPPQYKEDCNIMDTSHSGKPPIVNIPANGSVYLVRSHNLDKEKIILKASVDADADTVYWFFDNHLVGTSAPEEAIEVPTKIGTIVVKATDNMGRSSISNIQVKLVD